MSDITRILSAFEQGDVQAVDALLPIVYQELRIIAAQKLSREKPGQTLQPTALVHEAYLRMIGADTKTYQNRRHFFVAAAEAMRRILIENARRKQRLKRGGNQQRHEFDDQMLAIEGPSDDLLALDEAINKLTEKEPLVAELVKLHYFTGLTLEQAGEILNVTRRTANRYWSFARAWLYKEVAKGDSDR